MTCRTWPGLRCTRSWMRPVLRLGIQTLLKPVRRASSSSSAPNSAASTPLSPLCNMPHLPHQIGRCSNAAKSKLTRFPKGAQVY